MPGIGNKIFPGVKRSLCALEKNELIQKEVKKHSENSEKINKRDFELNKYQKNAINIICSSINTHSVFLLDGLTGSGKTEVYMSLMDVVIKSGKQCLILLS